MKRRTTTPCCQKKQGYLQPTFFFIRAAIYLVVWSALALWFSAKSREQDTTGNPDLTRRMQSASAPSVLVFALTLTFAAFDWLMSLDPHWYSTIFGVYIFSGQRGGGASRSLALMTLVLQTKGLLQRVSTVEHRHDIGKFLFGFIVFWAYIGFSQYFLIWYAQHPRRDDLLSPSLGRQLAGGEPPALVRALRRSVSVALVSHAKRSALGLGLGATILLVMHYVDLYWLVMPVIDVHGAKPSVLDLATLLGPVGLGVLVVALAAAKGPLFPLADPRLSETVKVENL